jgi:hypothetical protein
VDAELIQEITSSGSLVVSTIALLVSRLDRHNDNLADKGTVVALTRLESLLDGWIQRSRVTNAAVKAYLEGSGKLQSVHLAIGAQHAYLPTLADSKPLIEQWRTGRWKKKQNLTQFLRIYVPEFANAFETAARKRYAVLARAEFSAQPTDELANALNASLKQLEKALIQLQGFIRKNVQP